jgi:hypothetical protein
MFAHRAVAALFDRVNVQVGVYGSFVIAPVTCATLPEAPKTCWMRLHGTSC